MAGAAFSEGLSGARHDSCPLASALPNPRDEFRHCVSFALRYFPSIKLKVCCPQCDAASKVLPILTDELLL